MIYEVYWDNFNVELYNKIKKIKMGSNKEEYHSVSQAETLDKFRRVLMEVFDGDAEAMVAEIEKRAVETEDYETAAQMRDINTKLKEIEINE
jgi:protein-arginine kinase activator protein McsA